METETRERFDALFERVLAELPERIAELIETELVVIVDDEPSREMLEELAAEDPDWGDDLDPESLLGLHTGVPITEMSVEDHGIAPPTVHLFRRGLIATASSGGVLDEAELARQIRITLLHEIGHHYGLDEDDLDEVGFG